MPTTEPTVTTPADPLRSFECTPRYVYDLNSGGNPWLGIVVHQPTDEGKRAAARLKQDGLGACREVLTRTREEFFATGPGRELRDKEEKLREAERSVADANRAVEQLREQWKISVAADAMKDVTALEGKIDQHEKTLARLRVRVPVLREEVAKAQRDAANQLFALIREANAGYKRSADQRVEEARVALTAAVNTAWAEWVQANAEAGGVVADPGELMRMASAASEVPPAKDVDRSTMPDLLPLPPPAPPRQTTLFPWLKKPDDAGERAHDVPNPGVLDTDEKLVKHEL
ncbi:hypothetical protein J8F10_06695 [Gemmata sp. G18]|uniref:Uncharacterized protein n=1 Tax=Gemmata palustris TaxID=2822762 RepID=A0ABS5BMM3_9BACT|nr:hypothetical protein [Gemmata palustris]MBP3954969.1 hypothetical protein [Gemmata palustris]